MDRILVTLTSSIKIKSKKSTLIIWGAFYLCFMIYKVLQFKNVEKDNRPKDNRPLEGETKYSSIHKTCSDIFHI